MRTKVLAPLALAFSTALAGHAYAVDNVISSDSPDLVIPRTLIKAKDYKGALAAMMPLLQKVQHADLYSLIGFASRKTGDYKQAATFYAKALDFDADHKGALEYQGEMFVELGDMAKAKANLARLVKLCPTGCEEREDLEEAIAKAPASPAAKTN
jgi:tetratricopeptide (TPR) repeat protein